MTCQLQNRRLINYQYQYWRAKTYPTFSTSAGNIFWEFSGIFQEIYYQYWFLPVLRRRCVSTSSGKKSVSPKSKILESISWTLHYAHSSVILRIYKKHCFGIICLGILISSTKTKNIKQPSQCFPAAVCPETGIGVKTYWGPSESRPSRIWTLANEDPFFLRNSTERVDFRVPLKTYHWRQQYLLVSLKAQLGEPFLGISIFFFSSFFSAVPKRCRSKRSRTQKHANVRKRARMSAKERKRKSARERKKPKTWAQKSAKERFRVKIANNQVWNNQVWELPIFIFLKNFFIFVSDFSLRTGKQAS